MGLAMPNGTRAVSSIEYIVDHIKAEDYKAIWLSENQIVVHRTPYGGYQQTRKSGRINLIIRYPDNHCLVTRYPDAHYDYAKQSQFQKSRNVCKLNYNKGL